MKDSESGMGVLDELINSMRLRKPFCLVRFNDGEMAGIGSPGVTVARGDQVVDDSLSEALKQALTFSVPDYWVGMPCPECWPQHSELAETFVSSDYWRTLAVVLTNDNWEKAWRGVLSSVSDRPVWIVSGGDQDWSGLARDFDLNIARHIKIKTRNAWGDRSELGDVWKEAPSDAVVFLSCGPLSRVLAHWWWRDRQDNTVLDVGSTFDPFTRGVRHGCHIIRNGRNEAGICSVCNTIGVAK